MTLEEAEPPFPSVTSDHTLASSHRVPGNRSERQCRLVQSHCMDGGIEAGQERRQPSHTHNRRGIEGDPNQLLQRRRKGASRLHPGPPQTQRQRTQPATRVGARDRPAAAHRGPHKPAPHASRDESPARSPGNLGADHVTADAGHVTGKRRPRAVARGHARRTYTHGSASNGVPGAAGHMWRVELETGLRNLTETVLAKHITPLAYRNAVYEANI